MLFLGSPYKKRWVRVLLVRKVLDGLRFLPFDGPDFSHTVLECDDFSRLYEVIENLDSVPVPSGFSSFLGKDDDPEESGIYGVTSEDGRDGDPLMCVRVNQLLEFSNYSCVLLSPKNRAIWAYLTCLSGDTLVALYWW